MEELVCYVCKLPFTWADGAVRLLRTENTRDDIPGPIMWVPICDSCAAGDN